MGTGAIVIVSVGAEDPAKMRFAQDHDVVEAFSSDRADEPLDMSVSLGLSTCRSRNQFSKRTVALNAFAPRADALYDHQFIGRKYASRYKHPINLDAGKPRR
jgi:hypothetical protein